MKALGIFLAVVAGFALFPGHAFAQSIGSGIFGFPCIGTLGMPYQCAHGPSVVGLRGNTSTSANYASASVAGFNSPVDGGGGVFVKLGEASLVCNYYSTSSTISGVGTVGSSQITGVNTIQPFVITSLQNGELVGGSGTNIQIPPGAELANISGTSPNIVVTLTLPLTGTAIGSTTINNITFGGGSGATGDNGGTLIVDHEATPQCWQKTNYRGDPHEYGAYGDGNKDDTGSLQNWLGAYGTPLATGQTRTNFGPWIATIPANYQISQPLICPPYANLQAPSNVAAGTPANGGGPPSPPVSIVATSTFQDSLGQPALMMASQYCHISGLALDASAIGNFFFQPTGQTAMGSTTITCVSSTSGIVPGMPIGDSQQDLPLGTAVISVGSASCPGVGTTPTINVSMAATGTSSSTDTLTITGFYNVDVIGTHVGIDSHTLLTGGYYGVHCSDNQLDGLQIKDAQLFKSWDTGVHLTGHCDDVRIIGDVIDQAAQDGTGAGISASTSDVSLESGIVEQSGGPNINISGSRLVTVNGMVVDGGGGGGAGILVNNSTDVSICANRFQRSGGDTGGSHVVLSGILDNVSFCGNTYEIGSYGNDANTYPYYDFDVSGTPAPTLTNVHIYDTPEQAAVAVFSASSLAKALLAPLQIPQFTQNQLSGLTLSNGSVSQQINVAAGSAVDSTNSTLITLSSPCTVNLASSGAGGLDTGSTAPSTTYYIFVIASATANPGSTVTTPNCMASKSLVPTFQGSANPFAGTGYLVTATGGTNPGAMFPGNYTIYNPNPIAGVTLGDEISASDGSIPTSPPTTITAFAANTQPSPQPTGDLVISTNTITGISPSTSGIYYGMAVRAADSCIPSGAYVTQINSTTEITISKMATCTDNTPPQLSISGAQQLVLSAALTGSTPNTPTLTISTGLYRMVGAIYTSSNPTPTPQTFSQDGDTFYLNQPAAVGLSSVGATATPLALPVPTGIPVEAFGRCMGSMATGGTPGYILLYNPSVNPAGTSPANFPTAPGYAVQVVASGAGTIPSVPSYPFRLYTNSSGVIDAIAAGPSTIALNCMVDGWVLHRAQ